MVIVNENVCFIGHTFEIRHWIVCKLVVNPKKTINVIICQFYFIAKLFNIVAFLLSSLVTGLSFMSITWQVLELWQFSFVKDWPELQKSKIAFSEYCSKSRDQGNLAMRTLAQMSLLKCWWMLLNSRVTAFYLFWAIKGKSRRGKIPPPTKIRVKNVLTQDDQMDF